MSAPRKFVRAALLGCALAMVVPACGGSSAPPATPVAVTGEVSEMPIMLKVEYASSEARQYADAVKSTLEAAMSTAGYKVVQNSREAGLIAKATITATEVPSFIQITNAQGQVQKSYKVNVGLAVSSAEDTQLLDQESTEFESGDGTINDTAVRNTIALITNRGKITAYSAGLVADAEAKEDDKWAKANVEDCKKATSDTACDGVKAYVKAYPEGKYVGEARKAQEEFKLARKAKQEAEDWARANPDDCKKPDEVEDCDGVSKYLETYPTGEHAEEAKKIMDGSKQAMKVLTAKAEREAASAEKKACYTRCKKRYETAVYYDILVSRCVRNCN